MASYYQKLPLGALLLISDLPLCPDGVKTKKGAKDVYLKYTEDHVEKGVRAIHDLHENLQRQSKGVFRGTRRRFEGK